MSLTDAPAPTQARTAEPDQELTAAFAERLFAAALGAIEILTVHLGLRLGAYQALLDGPATPGELATRAGLDERYAVEWLEQQTVAGILTCPEPTAAPRTRRYALPPEHAVALLDPEHPAATGPLALAVAGIAGVLPQLLAAYRTGTGVPYAAYGGDFRDGQAGLNRPAFHHLLTGTWLAQGLPDVDAALRHGGRVADLACGAGWSSIALAHGYPDVRVDAFDVDDASISDARRNVERAGVADRVHCEVLDITSPEAQGEPGQYQLVTMFEALHDLARPVQALATCRRLCAAGGAVLVMDERVADTFDPEAGPIERFLYGASVLHCLPAGRTDPDSAATGTVMRASTVRNYALAAGFTDIEVLPIEHDLFRFYRLHS